MFFYVQTEKLKLRQKITYQRLQVAELKLNIGHGKPEPLQLPSGCTAPIMRPEKPTTTWQS